MKFVVAQSTDDSLVHHSNESSILKFENTTPITFERPLRHLRGIKWESGNSYLFGLDDCKMELLSRRYLHMKRMSTRCPKEWSDSSAPFSAFSHSMLPPLLIVDDDVVASPSNSSSLFFQTLSPSEDLMQMNRNAWVHSFPTRTRDAFDIVRRLEQMKTLNVGWADGMQPAYQWGEGYGVALSPQGLDWLAGQFITHYPVDLPHPYLYPTPDGGVQAEWSIGPNEASLAIDLAVHKAEWHCLNVLAHQSDEEQLELDGADAWLWLSAKLHQLGSM